MRKLYEFLWREEILQIMGITFLFVAFTTTAGVLFVPEEIRSAHYARTSTLFLWLFILIPPITVSVVVGIIMSAISFVRQRRALRG